MIRFRAHPYETPHGWRLVVWINCKSWSLPWWATQPRGSQ